MTGPNLTAIPGALLLSNDPRVRRALLRWCEARDLRPTFAQLEDERQRRRTDNHNNQHNN